MKIGILQTAYKKAADYGKFYNVQELGLARALSKKGHIVTLVKAVDGDENCYNEDCNLTIKLIPVKYLGINGLLDTNVLDPAFDVLIYFSDTQLIVPRVYKWCKKNNVAFYPYVGVMESHSESGIKRAIMDFISTRNLKIYKKCTIFAKTPQIQDFLSRRKCTGVKLTSVGLDETVMNHSDSDVNTTEIHTKISNDSHNFNLLFIGRMEQEKHPLEMLTVFENLLDSEETMHSSSLPVFSLTMIGDGYMYDEVATAADLLKKRYSLSDERLRIIRKVPYSDMHLYYKEADIYINLNLVEILGMSILEAMYYHCPVIAIDAPGPRFILDNKYGIIAGDFDEVTKKITKMAQDYDSYRCMTEDAFDHVRKEFTWDAIADKIISELNGD